MDEAGLAVKLVALAEVPIKLPPVHASIHLTTPAATVAFRIVEPPHETLVTEAERLVGALKGVTVTVVPVPLPLKIEGLAPAPEIFIPKLDGMFVPPLLFTTFTMTCNVAVGPTPIVVFGLTINDIIKMANVTDFMKIEFVYFFILF